MNTMLQNREVWKPAWAGHGSLGLWWLAFQQHQWSRGNFFHLDFHSMRGRDDSDIKRHAGKGCPTPWFLVPAARMKRRTCFAFYIFADCFRHSCNVRHGLCVLVCLPCWVLSSLRRQPRWFVVAVTGQMHSQSGSSELTHLVFPQSKEDQLIYKFHVVHVSNSPSQCPFIWALKAAMQCAASLCNYLLRFCAQSVLASQEFHVIRKVCQNNSGSLSFYSKYYHILFSTTVNTIGHLEIQWHKIKVFYEIKWCRFLVCHRKVQLDLLVDCSQGVLGNLWHEPCVALLWDNRIWRLLISTKYRI